MSNIPSHLIHPLLRTNNPSHGSCITFITSVSYVTAIGKVGLFFSLLPSPSQLPWPFFGHLTFSKHHERTLHLPSLALLLFGNDFYVLVIDVVLTQEAVYTSVHQVNSCRKKGGKRTKLNPVCQGSAAGSWTLAAQSIFLCELQEFQLQGFI